MRVGIVGAGIVGCACAFELARRGAHVTVFDTRAPGSGATRASAGILAPYTEGQHRGPLLEFLRRGLDAYDEFVGRVREDASLAFEYRRQGTVEIAESPERVALLQSRVLSSAPGLLEWLDPEELRRSEPALTTVQFGGLLCPMQGHIAVAPFIAALVRAAERHDAIFCRATVVDVVMNDLDCGLETIGKRQAFDRIVLSAGAWAAFLDPKDEIRNAVRPIKGQLLDLSWRGPEIHRVLWGSACYVVPWQDGTLLIGATSEDVGFDDRPTVDGVSGLLGAARDLLPLLPSATFNGVRVGLRPATTGVPIVRPSTDPRVVYATGHFRNGVLLAPITARVVADYLLDGKRDSVFEAQNGA